MNLQQNWKQIRKHFNRSNQTSFHVSIATIKPDGTPWVTPIGSLMLNHDYTGIYFEMFPRTMPTNFKTNKKVVIMGVNSGLWFWLKSIVLGTFSSSPAIRLVGSVGELRKATPVEIARLYKRLGIFRGTRGFKLLWSSMTYVRDVYFEEAVAVNLGKMTPRSIEYRN